MRVGFVGLGKLGLPVAAAMASRGVKVYGYDPRVKGPPSDASYEQGLADVLRRGSENLVFCDSLEEAAWAADVVFCAVQTPHSLEFEGITPLPEDRADFDYSALRMVASELSRFGGTLAVISTVLPGTMRREIEPLVDKVVYNPSFIAMGTTVRDFLWPEFVLIGGDDGTVESVYQTLGISPVRHMSIESAELTKVAYNVAIGQKIVLGNAVMEICHKLGGDVDEVSGALQAATRRIASGAYLKGGMGDGGACHPRDQIALSWLARKLELSCDPFEATMKARERQAEWLCDLMEEHDLPKGILGIAYKPRSRLVDGSSALLVANLLKERGYFVMLADPYVPNVSSKPSEYPLVYLHGCDHGWHPELAEGSVVIDPWRTWPDQEGVTVVRVGSERVREPVAG